MPCHAVSCCALLCSAVLCCAGAARGRIVRIDVSRFLPIVEPTCPLGSSSTPMDESSESSSPRPRNRVLASCKHALQAANSCTLPVLPCLVGRQRRLRFARYARKAAANLDIFGRLGCRCDSASELQCARPRSAASPALPALPASEPHGPRVPLRIITCTSPDFACACRSSLAARLAFLAALTRLHHQAKRLTPRIIRSTLTTDASRSYRSPHAIQARFGWGSLRRRFGLEGFAAGVRIPTSRPQHPVGGDDGILQRRQERPELGLSMHSPCIAHPPHAPATTRHLSFPPRADPAQPALQILRARASSTRQDSNLTWTPDLSMAIDAVTAALLVALACAVSKNIDSCMLQLQYMHCPDPAPSHSRFMMMLMMMLATTGWP
ncbi:uncharacterized protein PSANT_03772 [Moesziomyces antarcticus]|uniref:Uncharacterized protein n=1 Tax=Pseudozyma antarctica TaxID=84753 RepID=A0A5C3FPM6_PSEA2|nr:uncharacterized protein PSANT_03772 [Moesziomyces antarcticus]